MPLVEIAFLIAFDKAVKRTVRSNERTLVGSDRLNGVINRHETIRIHAGIAVTEDFFKLLSVARDLFSNES